MSSIAPHAHKVCRTCRLTRPLSDFARDKSRPDGRTYVCRPCRNEKARTAYIAKPVPGKGRAFVDARDGDVRQARRRVNYLVEAGLIPAPRDLACTDCGHVWSAGSRRHEYDHHLGYTAEHHESVEAVCTTCHHIRENQRRAA